MTREAYMSARAALIAEAEKFLEAGDLKAFEAKEKEVQELDNKYEALAKAQANMAALRDRGVAAGVAQATEVTNGVLDVTRPSEPQATYETVWAKVMMGQRLSSDEQAVFDKFNADVQNNTTGTIPVVIPVTVAKGIWKEAGELFPIIADTKMTFVPGDLTLLKETTSGSAQWYDEETEATGEELGIGELHLSGCELAKTVTVTWKLRKMAIEEFIPYIRSLLAEKMGSALARGIASGKGKPGQGDTFKPEAHGITTTLLAEADTPQVVDYSDEDDLDYDKLAAAMGKMKSSYKSGAAIYAKSDVIWNKLSTLKDLFGRPLFIPDVTEGGVGRIFGLRVKEDDSIPEDGVLIGNVAKGYAINVNEDMTIYTQEHVTKRKTDYMAYSIVDGDVKTSKAFAYIRKVTEPQT